VIFTVKTPYELVIDTDSSGWDEHTLGGIMTEVKRPVKMSFVRKPAFYWDLNLPPPPYLSCSYLSTKA